MSARVSRLSISTKTTSAGSPAGGRAVSSAMISSRPMSDQGSDDEQVAQRMDALLLRLLKTPPQSRADLAEAVRRAKGKKASRIRRKRLEPGTGLGRDRLP